MPEDENIPSQPVQQPVSIPQEPIAKPNTEATWDTLGATKPVEKK